MSNSNTVLKPKADHDLLNELIIDAIQDIKGKKIVKLNLKKIGDAPADSFIICEGDSSVQIRAISQNIAKRVTNELGLQPQHIEGLVGSRWVLVDYFDTIIHIFHPETRGFYDIEDLWNDADTVVYEDL